MNEANLLKNEVYYPNKVNDPSQRFLRMAEEEIESIKIKIDLKAGKVDIDTSNFKAKSKPQLKAIKLKFDRVLEAEIETQSKSKLSPSQISESKMAVTAQAMLQMLTIYSFEDLFVNSSFSGLKRLSDNSAFLVSTESKESYVFIFKIYRSLFGSELMENKLLEANMQRNIPMVLSMVNSIKKYGLESIETKKEAEVDPESHLLLPKPAEETISDQELKAIGLAALTIKQKDELYPNWEEKSGGLFSFLSNKKNPKYFYEVITKIFSKMEENHRQFYGAVQILIKELSNKATENFKSYELIENEVERDSKMKEFMLQTYEHFFKLFGIILCFGLEVNTTFRVIYNEVHAELFCDEDSYMKLAMNPQLKLHLELSSKGKETLLDFYSSLSKKNSEAFGVVEESTSLEPNQKDQSEIKIDKVALKKELTQSIYVQYNSLADDVYMKYDELSNPINDEEAIKTTVVSSLSSTNKVRLLQRSIEDSIDLCQAQKEDVLEKIAFKRDNSNQSAFEFVDLNIFKSDNVGRNITRFRDNFGECPAFYLLWTYYIFKSILVLSIVLGCIELTKNQTFNEPFIGNTRLHDFLNILFLVVFLSIWLPTFVLKWNATEQEHITRWGCSSEHAMIRYLDGFTSDFEISVFSLRIPVQKKWKVWLRYSFSYLVTTILIVWTTYSLIYLQHLLKEADAKAQIVKAAVVDPNAELALENMSLYDRFMKDFEKNPLPYFSAFSGIYVCILNKIYSFIVILLTKAENHETQSRFDFSRILKQTSFNFICQFFAIYYIMIVKSFNNECIKGNCAAELQMMVRSVFFSNLGATIAEIFIPIALRWLFNRNIGNCLYQISKIENIKIINNNDDITEVPASVKKFDLKDKFVLVSIKEDDDKVAAPRLKKEFVSNVQDKIDDSYSYLYKPVHDSIIKEYGQVIFLFAFICQFLILDYTLAVFFLVYIYLQRISDTCKFIRDSTCYLYDSAEGIGIYNSIIALIAILSCFTNIFILFYITGSVSPSEGPQSAPLIIATFDAEFIRKYIVIQMGFILIVFFLRQKILPQWLEMNKQVTVEFEKKAELYMLDVAENKFSKD